MNGYNPSARATDPQTSHDAAQSQQGAKVYDQVLAVLRRAGHTGCTLDDLAHALPWHDKVSISPVPAKLKEQGLAYANGETRLSDSGRQQMVHVAYREGEQTQLPMVRQRVNTRQQLRDRIAALEAYCIEKTGAMP